MRLPLFITGEIVLLSIETLSSRNENLRTTRADLINALGVLGGSSSALSLTPMASTSTSSFPFHHHHNESLLPSTSSHNHYLSAASGSEDSPASPQDDIDREELGEISNPLAVMADLALRQEAEREAEKIHSRQGSRRGSIHATEDWLLRSEQFYAGGESSLCRGRGEERC